MKVKRQNKYLYQIAVLNRHPRFLPFYVTNVRKCKFDTHNEKFCYIKNLKVVLKIRLYTERISDGMSIFTSSYTIYHKIHVIF